MNPVFLFPDPDVAARVATLGFDARPWDLDSPFAGLQGRDVVLAPDAGDANAAMDVALITELAHGSGITSLRVLDYPIAPWAGPGFNLSRQQCRYDVLVRKILEEAMDGEPLRIQQATIFDYSIAKQYSGEAPEQEWIVGAPAGMEGGFLPAGSPILMAGRGGIGKTRAATELCFLIGTWDGDLSKRPAWWGMPIQIAAPCVLITYEEHKASMHRQVQDLCKAHGIDVTQQERVIILTTNDPHFGFGTLIAPHPKTRALTPTSEYKRLTKQLRRLHAKYGRLGVIALDHALRAFAVESNSAVDANAAMALTARWAEEFGAAVITLAHTKKVLITSGTSDEEILQAVMGSVGWVSAVRAAVVMWQLEIDDEEEVAKLLADQVYDRRTTRRRYVQGQVLKHNVPGLYEARQTLRRNGVGFDNVTATLEGQTDANKTQTLTGLVNELVRLWGVGSPLQLSGKRGLYECREELAPPYCDMARDELRGLAKEALKENLLEISKVHWAKLGEKQASWLKPTQGALDGKAVADQLMLEVEKAWRAGKPFALFGPRCITDRRGELGPELTSLTDEQINRFLAVLKLGVKIESIGKDMNGKGFSPRVYKPVGANNTYVFIEKGEIPEYVADPETARLKIKEAPRLQ